MMNLELLLMVMMWSFRSRPGGRRNLIIFMKKDCARLEGEAGQARLEGEAGQVVISFLAMTLQGEVINCFKIQNILCQSLFQK